MSTISFNAVDEARQYEQMRERKGDEEINRYMNRGRGRDGEETSRAKLVEQ